jgi:hypothetical protein
VRELCIEVSLKGMLVLPFRFLRNPPYISLSLSARLLRRIPFFKRIHHLARSHLGLFDFDFCLGFLEGDQVIMAESVENRAVEVFDPIAVVAESLPVNGEMGRANHKASGREIVLGRNVHTMCLPITEPDANDECTGDKEAYMASVRVGSLQKDPH